MIHFSLAAPYWIKEPVSQLYAPGEDVRLDCQADGIPSPSISWTINGVPISCQCTTRAYSTYINTQPCACANMFVYLSKVMDVNPKLTLTSGGSLILHDVDFGETAIYQCHASNKHGTIVTNTNVYVIGGCLLRPHSMLHIAPCIYISILCFRAASTDPD